MQKSIEKIFGNSLLNTNQLSRFARDLNSKRNLHITLKQWRMLQAVVECGGFSDAAEYLHISQSTISYSIAKLQQQLGLTLLKIEGRKAYLTAEGQKLLLRSCYLLQEAAELELYAERIKNGGKKEIKLVITSDFPTPLLIDSLQSLTKLGKKVEVTLIETTENNVISVLTEEKADIAVSSTVPAGFQSKPLIDISYVPVTHFNHPLCKTKEVLMDKDLDQYVQISIHNTKVQKKVKNEMLLNQSPQWIVGSFDTAIHALCAEIGYAWVPKHRVKRWLDQGILVELPLAQDKSYQVRLHLIYGNNEPCNSSLKDLTQLLANMASYSQSHSILP